MLLDRRSLSSGGRERVSRIFVLTVFILLLTFAIGSAIELNATEINSLASHRFGLSQDYVDTEELNGSREDPDWWLMFRHDQQHTGYSASKAPTSSQILWVEQFDDWVRTSPSVHDNMVFIGSDDNRIHALDASTGERIWNYTVGGDVTSSAAVFYGRLYVGSDDRKLYCLNETTGELLWLFETAASILSSPCVAQNRVLFGSNDQKLYCLNAETGAHLWSFASGEKINSSPAVADGRVFFGSIDTRFYALNLSTGTEIWSRITIGSITVSPSVQYGRVFSSSYNTIYCYNASDGDPIWNYTAGGDIHSSPAVNEGKVYVGCNDRKMYCLNADTGESIWNFTTSDVIYSSPALAEGKVFFGSNDRWVYCLNANSGILIWSYSTGGYIRTSSPAVANGVVYIASTYSNPFSGKLFAFGNNPPVASNLKIEPLSPLTTDDLVGSYVYGDADGDPESGTEIRWFMNSILQSVHNDTLVIPSSATAKSQTWHFTVKPKDGKTFGALQTSPSATIQNSPPEASGIMILPSEPITTSNLTATYTYYDADNDPESGTEIRWFMNGDLKPEFNDTVNVPASATSKGETWQFTVRPKDEAVYGETYASLQATIQNSFPYLEKVAITPRPAYTNDTLVAEVTGWSDLDGDPEGYLYQWQKYEGGTWLNISGAQTSFLGPEDFVKGESLQILCNPTDGEDTGEMKTDTITISNGAPEITSWHPHENPTVMEGEIQPFNVTKADIDDDELTVEWHQNGNKVNEASDSYDFVADFESAGTWNLTVLVSDGENETAHEWILTVLNVERDISMEGLTPFKEVIGRSLSSEVNVTVENQGEIFEVFNVTLYANGTLIETREATLANGTSGVVTFVWNTSSFSKGNYTLEAAADSLVGENDLDDNRLSDGWVIVAMVGDIAGPEGYPDGKCDIRDVAVVAIRFGLTYPNPGYDPNYDLTGPTFGVADRKIDIRDVALVSLHFGEVDP